MKKKSIVYLLPLLVSGLCFRPALAQNQLANPSFEEDVANIGNADGWGRDETAKVKTVNGNASKDNRALYVTDGYVVASQELNIPQMAGQTLRFSIDAKADSDDAMMGLRIGFLTEDGQWNDVPLTWERKLTKEYESIQVSTVLSPTAKPGRLYVGIYRNAGSFYLDNAQLVVYGGLPDEHAHRAIELTREATYALNRIKAGGNALTETQKRGWMAKADEIAGEARYAKPDLVEKFAEHEKTVADLNVELFKVLGKGKDLLMAWAPPFTRLAPDAIPPLAAPSTARTDIVALRGEYQAFGLDVTNAGSAPRDVTVQVQGLPEACTLTWRRQVFTENWYQKGEIVLADPMTRLATDKDGAHTKVSPAEIARLNAAIHIPAETRPGVYKIKVSVLAKGQSYATRSFNLRVLPKSAPPRRMAHYAFAYLNTPIAGYHLEETVKDLVAHGVTDIEWANRPPVKFDDEGNLLSVDWGFYDNLLKYFGPTSIRLNTFWPYAPQTVSGKDMPYFSPVWKNAMEQLLRAWIDHAAEKGVGADRITLLIQDEIHSSSLEKAPEPEIHQYVESVKFFKEKFPQIKNYLTLTYFAFAPDAKAVIPVTDVMMPYLPMPDSLPFNAPPTYNPRLAFAAEVDPALRAERDKRGMELWSYHVDAGRSAGEFWHRVYGLQAAATGHTGIGFWAYDVTLGKTWDDTDGGLLDYSFVYNGTEDHPLAKKWNVTGEGVVPSIRWESVRAGLQDSDILLALQLAAKDEKVALQTRRKISELLEESHKMFLPGGIVAEHVTFEVVDTFAARMRELYASLD